MYIVLLLPSSIYIFEMQSVANAGIIIIHPPLLFDVVFGRVCFFFLEIWYYSNIPIIFSLYLFPGVRVRLTYTRRISAVFTSINSYTIFYTCTYIYLLDAGLHTNYRRYL